MTTLLRPAVFLGAAAALLGATACEPSAPSTPGATQPPGTGGSPTVTRPTESDFTLLFRDDFNELDSSRWQLMTHSWDTNLALFSSETVSVEDGQLVLRLLPAPEGTEDQGASKPFLGAEVRSTDTLTYGRVRARARLARGSAVVSSLVTIYTPWPADN